MRLFKSQEEKEQIAGARAEYNQFVMAAASAGPDEARRLASNFKVNSKIAVLSAKEQKERGDVAFLSYAENVLADDILSIDEEMAFQEVGEALGVEPDILQSDFRDLLRRLVIAKANDGRLPIIETPQLIPKKNEVVHFEMPAALMKEVTLREWRGGYSGVSFPIAKGLRYRTGSSRGHSVVVGTEMQVEDTGMFTITSQRIAYLGARKTIEVPYTKLMNIDVFTDGVRIHASNRQKAPLFTVEEGMGDAIAATLNAAMKRFNE
jgi:hypothetical protein